MPQGTVTGANNDGVSPAAMHETTGGARSKLGMTAANVIKASKGRIARISITAAGTGGAWVFNDSATLAGASAANVVYTQAGATPPGAVPHLDIPCANGIVLSAVPTGSPMASISYR